MTDIRQYQYQYNPILGISATLI